MAQYPIKSATASKNAKLTKRSFAKEFWAVGSAVERFPDKKEVLGSTPRRPTHLQ